MIGIVVAAHGGLARALVDTAEMVAGKQEGIAIVAFEQGQSVEDLETQLAAAVSRVDFGRGVIVAVDITGGSPYNAACMLAMTRVGVAVASGLNLPMLLELLLARHDNPAALVERALAAGRDGIGRFVRSARREDGGNQSRTD